MILIQQAFGKKSQVVNQQKYPFSDCLLVLDLLEEKMQMEKVNQQQNSPLNGG